MNIVFGSQAEFGREVALAEVIIGGRTLRVPVVATTAQDPFGTGTRAYNFGVGTRIPVGLNSTAEQAIPALGESREVMFHASTRCFIRFGSVGLAAAQVAAGHLVLEAGERFHLRIPAGVTHFRVIRDSADGFLSVIPVL